LAGGVKRNGENKPKKRIKSEVVWTKKKGLYQWKKKNKMSSELKRPEKGGKKKKGIATTEGEDRKSKERKKPLPTLGKKEK